MALTTKDKVWLVKFATIIMHHLARLINIGPKDAQTDWVTGGTMNSFEEKMKGLIKK